MNAPLIVALEKAERDLFDAWQALDLAHDKAASDRAAHYLDVVRDALVAEAHVPALGPRRLPALVTDNPDEVLSWLASAGVPSSTETPR